MKHWGLEAGGATSTESAQEAITPLCSFLCITYNHAPYIEECLRGFLEQETSFPFEILIHDDCSTDGTDEIIKAYAAKYPKIIKPLYEEENQYSKGDEGSPFFGIMHKMAAKYIAFCEGDDYWDDPKKIETQVRFLESNPDFVLCYHRCHTIDSSGIVENDDGSLHRDASPRALQRLEVLVPTRTACYRNVVDYLEPNLLSCFRKILNGDTFLWTLLGQHGGAKYIADIRPAYYRLHAGGVWSSLSSPLQFRIHAKSFFYMSEYHYKCGNEELSSFLLCLSLQNLCFASSSRLTQKEVDSVIKTLLDKRGGAGRPLAGFHSSPIKLLVRLLLPRTHFIIISMREKLRKWRGKLAPP